MALIGNEIIRLKETDSTNNYLMDWISREKPAEGTLVVTDCQTAGRGTDGSTWESEPYRNLTFSIILYPSFLPVEEQFYLNKFISLGLADCIAEALPGCDNIRIKWPNDIYIGDKKVAGTLIQNGVKSSRFEYSVIGIGLNVNQVSFRGDAPNPVSLKIIAGKEFILDDLLKLAISKIEQRYELLKQGGRLILDHDYLDLLYRMQKMDGFIYKGKKIIARITGLNRFGQLILEIPGVKIIECDQSEIKFET